MGCFSVPPTSGRSLTDVCKIVLCDECLAPPLAPPRRKHRRQNLDRNVEGTRKETHADAVPQDALGYAGDLGCGGVRSCSAEGAQGTGCGRPGCRCPPLDPHMHNIRGMLIVGWQLF